MCCPCACLLLGLLTQGQQPPIISVRKDSHAHYRTESVIPVTTARKGGVTAHHIVAKTATYHHDSSAYVVSHTQNNTTSRVRKPEGPKAKFNTQLNLNEDWESFIIPFEHQATIYINGVMLTFMNLNLNVHMLGPSWD